MTDQQIAELLNEKVSLKLRDNKLNKLKGYLRHLEGDMETGELERLRKLYLEESLNISSKLNSKKLNILDLVEKVDLVASPNLKSGSLNVHFRDISKYLASRDKSVSLSSLVKEKYFSVLSLNNKRIKGTVSEMHKLEKLIVEHPGIGILIKVNVLETLDNPFLSKKRKEFWNEMSTKINTLLNLDN